VPETDAGNGADWVAVVVARFWPAAMDCEPGAFAKAFGLAEERISGTARGLCG